MAKETLSVDLDPMLIERVRRYSEEHGTDVAETIGELIESLPTNGAGQGAGENESLAGIAGADWEAKLTPAVRRMLGAGVRKAADEDDEEWVRELPPLTRSLLGIAAGEFGEEDYKEYLWRKYGP